MQSATAHFTTNSTMAVNPRPSFVFSSVLRGCVPVPAFQKREQAPVGDLLSKLRMIRCTFGEDLSSVHHDWTLNLGYTCPGPDECSTAGAAFRCIAEHHVITRGRVGGANNAAEVEMLPVAGHLRQTVW
jgi:hypothetical protein